MKKVKIKTTILVTILSGMLLCGPVLAGESLRTPQKEPRTSRQTFSGKKPQILERDFSRPEKIEKFAADEIIVKFKGDQKPFRVIRVSRNKVLREVGKYRKRADVVYAEPNYIVRTMLAPDDPHYPLQWHLDNSDGSGVNAEEAWDISNGSGAVVAVIDTGIAYEDYRQYRQAPDLADTCFVEGYDFVNDDDHPNDDDSHGTHVAGTIAQSTNNGIGTAGLAYGACLMPVKVLDYNGIGYVSDVADGVIFAADHGAQVINLSLGGSEDSETLKNAMQYAYEKGVTIVAAAGNDSSSSLIYPAAYNDYVIAVGATRYDKALAYYSNYGSSLDLVAPGGQLYVEETGEMLDQNNDGYWDGVLQNTFHPYNIHEFHYYFFEGTSMAAPHVAAAAALLISNGNAVTPDETRAALQNTAQDLGVPGRDDTYGYGLIDAFAALQYLTETARFGFFDNEISQGNTCAAGTLDFSLIPSNLGTVFLGELIGVDINNEDGALPFEYQVRAETFEEEGFCGDLNVLAVIDGFGCYSGKLKDFIATATMFDSQDSWGFTITDPENNSPGQTCDFEFIFEGWQEGLNFNQGFTDQESVLGTVESADAGGAAGEIFFPDILLEANPDEMPANDYDEEENEEELGDAAIEENLEDDINDDIGEDINEDADGEDKNETSSDIKDEEKIVTPKQEDSPDDDDSDDDDPDDEKYKKNEDEDGDEEDLEEGDDSDGANSSTQEYGANSDNTGDIENTDSDGANDSSQASLPDRQENGANDDGSTQDDEANGDDSADSGEEEGGLNKNMVDSVQTSA